MRLKLQTGIIVLLLFSWILSPVTIAMAADITNPLQIDHVTYKIGDRVVETKVTEQNTVATIEPKAVVVRDMIASMAPVSIDEAKNIPDITNKSSLKAQPILKVESRLSVDKKNKNIILTVNIQNIGNVKAKNVNSVLKSSKDVDILGVSGGGAQSAKAVTSTDAKWTGEVDTGQSQELVYKFAYTGSEKDTSGNITVPLTISGMGSDNWIIDFLFQISKAWILQTFGILIPIDTIPTPGLEILLVITSLVIVGYYLHSRDRYE